MRRIETITTTFSIEKEGRSEDKDHYPQDIVPEAEATSEPYSHTEEVSVTSPIGDYDSQGRTLDGTKDDVSDDEYGTMRQTTETTEYHVEPVPEEQAVVYGTLDVV